jgi:hypothetical protein
MVPTALPESETTNVRYYRPSDPGEAVEFDSFVSILPQLRESHAGEYVAVLGGRVIAAGVHADAVFKRAEADAGAAPFYCAWVEPPGGYVFRFGSASSVTEVRPA